MPEPDASPSEQRIESRALRGLPWAVLGNWAARVLSLAGTILIVRFLTPAEVGVVMTGLLLVAFLDLLTDSGLGVSLIVHEELGDRLLGTVLTCMVGVAATLAVAAALAADPIADVFGAPGLADILPVLAISIVFTGICFFYINLLQRMLLFERRFAGMFATTIGYVGVAVPAAAAGAGVWSMVAGHLAGTALSATVLWLLCPRRVRPAFDLASARVAYRTARPFLAQAGTAFISNNGHSMAVAGLLGTRAMGLYQTSYRVAELPARALAQTVAQATFPAFARLRNERERNRAVFMTSLRYVTFAGLPAAVGLAVLASPFALGVLGPRWADMPPVLTTLAIWGAIGLVGASVAWFINGTGGAGWLARINVIRLLIAMPLVVAAALVFDSIVAVAAVLCLDALIELTLLVAFAHRRLEIPATTIWTALQGILAATAVLAAAAVGARLVVAGAGGGPLTQLFAGIAAGLVGYLATIRLVEPSLLPRGRDLLRSALRPSPKAAQDG